MLGLAWLLIVFLFVIVGEWELAWRFGWPIFTIMIPCVILIFCLEKKWGRESIGVSSFSEAKVKANDIVNKLRWERAGSAQTDFPYYVCQRYKCTNVADFDWLVKYITVKGGKDKYGESSVFLKDSMYTCNSVNRDYTVTQITRKPFTDEEYKVLKEADERVRKEEYARYYRAAGMQPLNSSADNMLNSSAESMLNSADEKFMDAAGEASFDSADESRIVVSGRLDASMFSPDFIRSFGEHVQKNLAKVREQERNDPMVKLTKEMLRQRREELREKIEELSLKKEEYRELRDEVNGSDFRAKCRKDATRDGVTDIEEYRERLEDYRERLADLKDDIDDLECEIEDLRYEIDDLKDELSDIYDDLSD